MQFKPLVITDLFTGSHVCVKRFFCMLRLSTYLRCKYFQPYLWHFNVLFRHFLLLDTARAGMYGMYCARYQIRTMSLVQSEVNGFYITWINKIHEIYAQMTGKIHFKHIQYCSFELTPRALPLLVWLDGG
jgi:hypothetical protein